MMCDLCSDPYYEDAWWAKLGYTSGRVKTSLGIYHSRYHDGYSACTDEDYHDCGGVLLGAYTMVSHAVAKARVGSVEMSKQI